MEGFSDVRLLADLLCPKVDEETNFDDEQKVRPYSKKPDPTKRKIVKEDNSARESQKKKSEEELFEANTEDDWRKTPEWDLCYKQQVNPSDVYLQMTGKTQSTSSCEEIVISIKLPGEQSKNIDVKVTPDKLDVLSPMYRLSVPLPHPVDPQKGNEAKWYPEEEQLKLTLTMDREFDYMNF